MIVATLKRTAVLLVAVLSDAAVAAQPATLGAADHVKRWETFLNTADATGKLSYITTLDPEVAAAAKGLLALPHGEAVLLGGSMLRYLARANELGVPIAPQARDAVQASTAALYRRDSWSEDSAWISSATPSSGEQALYARFLYWLHRNNSDVEPLRRSFLVTRAWKARGWKPVTPAEMPWVSLWAAEAYREAVVLESADLAALAKQSASSAEAQALLAVKPAAPGSSRDPYVASILAARAAPVTRVPVPEFPFTPHAAAPDFAISGKYALDDKGILVVRYGNTNQYGNIGTRYNATFIAHYATALHRDYLLHGGADIRRKFFLNVDWLMARHEAKTWRGLEYWIWPFDFDNDHFAAKAPWFSGMTQGHVLAALAEAYDLSGNIEYYRAAERTLRSFYVPADAEGVATPGPGHVWYEEVAAVGTGSSKILNGHIAALSGLWTYLGWTGRQDVRTLYELGVTAVLRDIPRYDAGFLSFYSDEQHKVRTFAPVLNYNSLHVHQLLWLYAVCEHPRFLDYAMRFARYDDPGLTFTVAGSTNAKTHGPDKLNMTLGSNFWSHSTFPTWVQVDLGSLQEVDGVTLLGYVQKTAPRDYDILVSADATNWEKLVERKGNAERYPTERFPKRTIRYVRTVIYSDNGNRNVALAGIGLHRGNGGNPTAVSDWNSYGTRSRPATAFVRYWTLSHPGTLYLDLVKPAAATVVFDGAAPNEMFVYGSNDLQKWEPVAVTRTGKPATYHYAIPNSSHRYLKLDVPKLAATGRLRFVLPPAVPASTR